MRWAAFLWEGAFGCRRRPGVSNLLLLVATAASSGDLVAYADSGSDASVEKPQLPQRKKVVVLGTGWGGTTFLRNLETRLYDVQVISPRNYFAFTPLLPSVTSGTVEPRSIVEPIRRVLEKKGGEIKFWEAECFKIDPQNKQIHCRSNLGTNLDGNGEFLVDYDYLVVAVGARTNLVVVVRIKPEQQRDGQLQSKPQAEHTRQQEEEEEEEGRARGRKSSTCVHGK